MFYCVNCGEQRTENAAYCYNCGRRFDSSWGLPPLAGPDSAVKPEGVPWRAGQVALGIVVVVVLSIPVTFIALGAAQLAGRHEEAMTTWLSVHLLGVAVIGAVWFFGIKKFNAPWSILGLRPAAGPRLRTVLLTAGALIASLAASGIYGALVDLVDSDFLSPPDVSNIVFPGAAALLTFQALAVATPVVEEVFFRGFVFAGLVPRLGMGWATVASAVVFSLFHVDPAVYIPIFVTGLLLAWLYQQTGSLWPSIAAHAGQNALALAVELYGV